MNPHAKEACHEVPGTSRRPGRTDLKVPTVGFGAWAAGGDRWGPQDDKAALDARAWDSGLSLLRNGCRVRHGHSESLIGRFIMETGHHPAVATEIPPKNYRWPA